MADVIVTKENIYLSADRKRVVEEGDPDAAYLLAAAGTPVAAEVVAHHKLSGRADKDAVVPTGAETDGRLAAQRRLANLDTRPLTGAMTTAGPTGVATTPEDAEKAARAAQDRAFAQEQAAHDALKAEAPATGPSTEAREQAEASTGAATDTKPAAKK